MSSTFSGIVSLGPLSDTAAIKRLDDMFHGNCRLIADRDTLHPVAWSEEPGFRVGQVLCETYWLDPFTNQVGLYNLNLCD